MAIQKKQVSTEIGYHKRRFDSRTHDLLERLNERMRNAEENIYDLLTVPASGDPEAVPVAPVPHIATFSIDGGGSEPDTGAKRYIELPSGIASAKIKAWRLLADAAGDAVVTVKRSNIGSFPTASDITGGNPPSLSSQQYNSDSALSGWDVDLSALDILEFSLDSISGPTWVQLELQLES